jgi:hypothetical protein
MPFFDFPSKFPANNSAFFVFTLIFNSIFQVCAETLIKSYWHLSEGFREMNLYV